MSYWCNGSVGDQLHNFIKKKYPQCIQKDNEDETDNEINDDENNEQTNDEEDNLENEVKKDEDDNEEENTNIIEKGYLELNETKIICRATDGKVNLTSLCQAGGKLVSDWKRLDRTQAYLEVLSHTMGYPIIELMTSEQGRNGGTWVHPMVAISCAQWISPDFEVKVSKWIYELKMTGSVSLGKEKIIAELDSIWKQKFLEAEQSRIEYEKRFNQIEKELFIIKNPEFSREHSVYPEQPGIYLVSDPCDVLNRLKYGHAGSISDRIYEHYKSFKCVVPKIHYYHVTKTKEEASRIEKILHHIFRDERNPENSEWLESISISRAIKVIESVVKVYYWKNNIDDEQKIIEKDG
jgi:hypothetical protein